MLIGELISYIPGRFYKIPIKHLNYAVNDQGDVAHIRKDSYRIVYNRQSGGKHNRYEYVTLHREGRPMKFSIHRLMLLTFRPIANPELYDGHHEDRNPVNNRITNLRWKLKLAHFQEHGFTPYNVEYEY